MVIFYLLVVPILILVFYVVIKEGISKVCYLYFLACVGWWKYRKGYTHPLSILALKKLNFIFAKYRLY